MNDKQVNFGVLRARATHTRYTSYTYTVKYSFTIHTKTQHILLIDVYHCTSSPKPCAVRLCSALRSRGDLARSRRRSPPSAGDSPLL